MSRSNENKEFVIRDRATEIAMTDPRFKRRNADLTEKRCSKCEMTTVLRHPEEKANGKI